MRLLEAGGVMATRRSGGRTTMNWNTSKALGAGRAAAVLGFDWRPSHDFGTTRTGTVEQRCIQERTRRHVVRAGHPSKLRHQRSDRSAVQLAGDVSPRRNDQREHEQPGFCDRAARRRSGTLARRRSPYLQPADGRPDQLRYASEPADVSQGFSRVGRLSRIRSSSPMTTTRRRLAPTSSTRPMARSIAAAAPQR